jgi:hypothetical protein
MNQAPPKASLFTMRPLRFEQHQNQDKFMLFFADPGVSMTSIR